MGSKVEDTIMSENSEQPRFTSKQVYTRVTNIIKGDNGKTKG